MTAIDLFIPGTPAPGGSKTAIPMRRSNGELACRFVFSKRHRKSVPMPILTYVDSGKHNAAWKQTVAAHARRQFRCEPLDGPLRVLFRFYLERPQAHHIGDDRSRPLKPQFLDVIGPGTKPDATKLVRSTEDALTGILWVDDAQVIQQYAEKLYAGPGQPTGVRVMVTKVIPDHAPEGLFAEASA